MEESELRVRCATEQLQELEKLWDKYREVFSKASGVTDLTEHVFELIEEKPVIRIPYRASPKQNEIRKRDIKRMLEINIIKKSDFNSPGILMRILSKPRAPASIKKIKRYNESWYLYASEYRRKWQQPSVQRYLT